MWQKTIFELFLDSNTQFHTSFGPIVYSTKCSTVSGIEERASPFFSLIYEMGGKHIKKIIQVLKRDLI